MDRVYWVNWLKISYEKLLKTIAVTKTDTWEVNIPSLHVNIKLAMIAVNA